MLKLLPVFALNISHLLFFDNLAKKRKNNHLVFIKLYKQSDEVNEVFSQSDSYRTEVVCKA